MSPQTRNLVTALSLLLATACSPLLAAGVLPAEYRCEVEPKPLASKKGWPGGRLFFNGMTQMKRVSWVYTWGVDFRKRGDLPDGVQFVPMIWGRGGVKWLKQGGVDSLIERRKSGEISELLGFNEPDHPRQSHMTVEEAIDDWPWLMKTGLRLGSPAVAGNRGDWLDRFMAEIAKRHWRVDFICVHRYGGPNVESFLKTIDGYYERYKKPIWLTEFAVVEDGAESHGRNRQDPAAVARFMKDLTAALDQRPYVERYCWFCCPQEMLRGSCSALFTQGSQEKPIGTWTLTKLGELYRDLPGGSGKPAGSDPIPRRREE
jgi:hypothetical protein